MKYECKFLQLLTSFIIGILLPSSASAYVVYGGTKSIKVDEEIQLETEPSTYYTVTGSWSIEGNSCNFVSKSNRSCTIRGIREGEATIRWVGVVGSADYEYYWYINVSGNPEPDPDPKPDPKPNPASEESWADSHDISWFDKNNDVFVLSTSKELSGVAYLVNNGYTTFKGKTIKLGKDIDLSGRNWSTIGIDTSHRFEGSFDGQNHTISGIYITKQNSMQEIYGFFGVSEGTSILNTIFKGRINIEYPDFENENGEWNIGGIVGRLNSSTTISHCVSDMDISFKISKSRNKVKIGGVCGRTYGNNSKIRNCSHSGIFDVGDHEKLLHSMSELVMIGGIVGESNNCIIEMCENNSSQVLCYVEPFRDSGWKMTVTVGIGGISGSGGKTSYCRSIIDEIRVANESYGNDILLYLGGINGGIASNPNVVNCYSVIKNVDLIKGELWSGGGGVFYGGINAKISGSSKSKANFSNSDYSIDLPGWISIDTKSGDNGDVSFSSEQMKTDNFLNQLNTYSFIEEGKGIWKADENGYPCIAETHYLTGINRIILNKETDKHVYNLNGQRLLEPSKGINIIGGKKVLIK